MKKIIVALLCVVPIACFAMEENKDNPRVRDIPRFLSSIVKSQERQANAAELQAVSTALIPCLGREGYNSSYNKYIFVAEKKSECQLLKKRYDELIAKNQNNS